MVKNEVIKSCVGQGKGMAMAAHLQAQGVVLEAAARAVLHLHVQVAPRLPRPEVPDDVFVRADLDDCSDLGKGAVAVVLGAELLAGLLDEDC